MSNEILCPKCGSNQITADKKGFSGKKALVGGILTGGIGLLAGTIGSSNVVITCLACGNTFKPGQGKLAPTVMTEDATDNIAKQTVMLANTVGVTRAIAYYKNATGVDLASAMQNVKRLCSENGVQIKKPNYKPILIVLGIILFFIILGIFSNDDKSNRTNTPTPTMTPKDNPN